VSETEDAAGSTWDAGQYARFREERSRPFFDLLDLVSRIPGGRAVDLGCGTGELTRILHGRLGAAETVGIDSSETMLAESAAHEAPGLRFKPGDIDGFRDERGFDVVFSNAPLQWVPGHAALLPALAGLLRPGGQLAVQMPANHDHPSHLVAHRVAGEAPFRSALGGYVREVPVMAAEWYASLLNRLGFEDLHVRVQVYGHHLASRDEVVEWVKGTLLTDYRRRLSPEVYETYLARYREALLPLLEDAKPYFYPFKRILLYGRR
jgi:trans-aconitate 2-methyltransferase